MNDENELLEPLATEAGQLAIVRAIRDISSLEYAVRAELAASLASAKAGEASQSAIEASEAEDKAKDWATKTDTYVEQETITIPPEQEGEEPTTETINLYSARYYAALALDIYNNMQFDSVPTENSTNMVNSGTVYSALDLKADKINTYTKTEVDTLISTAVSNLVNSAPSTLDTLEELADALGDDPNFATTIATLLGLKADKSTTYTKTEVDTALSNVLSTLTFDNVPTANSDNPVKSSGIKTALDGKQDTLTFDSTPTANSTNPVTSGGVYTALLNVNIDIDDEITEDSYNPVTSAAIYEALLNLPSGSEISGDVIYDVLSLPDYINSLDLLSGYTPTTTIREVTVSKDGVARIYGECSTTGYTIIIYVNGIMVGSYSAYARITMDKHIIVKSGDIIGVKVDGGSNWRNVSITFYPFVPKVLSEQMYSNVLYENSNLWSSGSVVLNDTIDNYDFLCFETTAAGYPLFSSQQILRAAELLDTSHTYFNLYENGSRSFEFTVSSDKKTLNCTRTDLGLRVRKIIGIKLAKGGYSGIVSDARMTVKSGVWESSGSLGRDTLGDINIAFDSPMPDTNYVVLITPNKETGYWTGTSYYVLENNKRTDGFTLHYYQDGGSTSGKVGISWIAIRPNSYTREGMVEDVLFSSENGIYSGTINLSGNISDYDLIVFETNRKGDSGSLNQNRNIFTANSLLSLNGTTSLGNCILLTGYSSDYIKLTYINDNTLNAFDANRTYLLKIKGIKFGRYVSGVAVDTTVTQNSNAVVTSGAVYDALQNYTPSGGGSSITVDSTITQNGTNPVEGGAIYAALDNKADLSTTYTKTEVDTALGNKQGTLTFDTAPTSGSSNPVTSDGVYTALASKGDVTTNTDQNITGTKTFVGSKKVAFKQSTANDKLGFTLYGNTGTERGYLEFNPTNTVDGVTGLMTLGNYATSAAALTQVGFRRYSNISGASGAYNLLMPMVADARTPFSLTTTYLNFYLPLGFTDGTTTVKTAKSGLVDLSPLLASLEARIAALEGN